MVALMNIKRKAIIITTPSGPCPAQLVGHDYNNVVEWCQEVRYLGLTQHSRYYTATALRYWVREFYPCYTHEYVEIVPVINEFCWERDQEVVAKAPAERLDMQKRKGSAGLKCT